MSAFYIGDRVRVTTDYMTNSKGELGTVCRVDLNGATCYGVEMDWCKNDPDLHDPEWYSAAELELMPPKPLLTVEDIRESFERSMSANRIISLSRPLNYLEMWVKKLDSVPFAKPALTRPTSNFMGRWL